MANEYLKQTAKKSRIKHYEIAEALEIRETEFSMMLRHELPEAKKEEVLKIIRELTINKVND